MKKNLVLAVALLIAMCASAQESKHEISAGVGYATEGQFIDVIGDIGAAFFGCQSKEKGFSGSINLDYGYRVSRKFLVGLSLSYSRIAEEQYRKSEPDKLYGTSTGYYYSVMPTVKANWIEKEHFTFYSRVSAGLLLCKYDNKVEGKNDDDKDDDMSKAFAFQVSPVGLEFGNALRGYVELGFGAAGIVSGGIRYRF